MYQFKGTPLHWNQEKWICGDMVVIFPIPIYTWFSTSVWNAFLAVPATEDCDIRKFYLAARFFSWSFLLYFRTHQRLLCNNEISNYSFCIDFWSHNIPPRLMFRGSCGVENLHRQDKSSNQTRCWTGNRLDWSPTWWNITAVHTSKWRTRIERNWKGRFQ